MTEKQNIEYKVTWRDEYLKWLCGFANAQGGELIIGVHDNGEVAGLPDAARLLEDIPNKAKDILGIMVDVNVQDEDGKEYLEIKVDPYPNPISYKGQYHYRSGSTKQELKGAALDRFLLRKQGKRWDGVPVPRVTPADLSDRAFSHFRKKAVSSKRLPKEEVSVSNNLLLEKLRLIEGTYLKRAALLLFHPDPEAFFTGAYIKVGFFKTHTDLLYHDTIHGNLFEQVDKTMDLLFTKYMKAMISYDGIYRVETYPFPEEAIREAVINAVIHKDYGCGIPIQISVYDDQFYIWNHGQLPDDWTVEKLLDKHPSLPNNPDIAHTFFRAGYIESWGRGMKKILDECTNAGLPEPAFDYDANGLMVEFKGKPVASSEKTPEESSENVGETSGKRRGNVGKTSGKILELMKTNPGITIPEIAAIIGVTERSIERNIQKLHQENFLERVGAANGGSWEVKE
ncbi:transcriptional regulator [Niastella koreensis]|uniref:Transcriptional regulator n=2 Tax=Niastella koreensis TaxID=354356 RepID=A0ABX3NQS4_9BACT|nr:ATP-binding protein [Niastella koreensis]AEW01037.1 putative transcriptional regulator [Niastella koreensis GR20-10]OQP42641.1 transcriptional regulator [Niastella koreensis]